MSPRSFRVAVAAPLILSAALAANPPLAYQGPRLSATYTPEDVRPMASGVSMTFRFALSNTGDTDAVVDRIVLSGLAGPDAGYATFDGGTLRAGDTLTGSSSVVVPRSDWDAWRAGRRAALYVYTRTERGDTFRTRVDASVSAVTP